MSYQKNFYLLDSVYENYCLKILKSKNVTLAFINNSKLSRYFRVTNNRSNIIVEVKSDLGKQENSEFDIINGVSVELTYDKKVIIYSQIIYVYVVILLTDAKQILNDKLFWCLYQNLFGGSNSMPRLGIELSTSSPISSPDDIIVYQQIKRNPSQAIENAKYSAAVDYYMKRLKAIQDVDRYIQDTVIDDTLTCKDVLLSVKDAFPDVSKFLNNKDILKLIKKRKYMYLFLPYTDKTFIITTPSDNDESLKMILPLLKSSVSNFNVVIAHNFNKPIALVGNAEKKLKRGIILPLSRMEDIRSQLDKIYTVRVIARN